MTLLHAILKWTRIVFWLGVSYLILFAAWLLRLVEKDLDSTESPEVIKNPRRGSPRRLSADDVDSLMRAVDAREDPLWKRIDLYLDDTAGAGFTRYPWEARVLRLAIRRLRKLAYRDGLDWGKQ